MSSCLPSAHLYLSCIEIVASNLFGTRDGFHGRQFFPQVVCWGRGRGWFIPGWLKSTTFTVHFISIIVTLAISQIVRHQLPEVGDPGSRLWTLCGRIFVSYHCLSSALNTMPSMGWMLNKYFMNPKINALQMSGQGQKALMNQYWESSVEFQAWRRGGWGEI